MRKSILNRWTLAASFAMLAVLGWSVSPSPAKNKLSRPGQPAVDLSSELAALDGYLTALHGFDKKCGALNKRSSFTAVDVDVLQRNADELKGRVSTVQGALREAIRKLKAAGQWDGLDALVAGVNQSPAKELLRQESFKRLLEDSVSQLNSDSSQISKPIEVLRRRVKAQLSDFGTGNDLTWRAVPAAYVRPAAEPFMNIQFRCRLAMLRIGISAAAGKHNNTGSLGSQDSLDDASCYCAHDFDSCDFAT